MKQAIMKLKIKPQNKPHHRDRKNIGCDQMNIIGHTMIHSGELRNTKRPLDSGKQLGGGWQTDSFPGEEKKKIFSFTTDNQIKNILQKVSLSVLKPKIKRRLKSKLRGFTKTLIIGKPQKTGRQDG